MAKSEIVECKIPKGRRWFDSDVIKMNSPYIRRYGGQSYNQYGKYCYFYPIDNDLFIKGMFSYQKKVSYQSEWLDTPTFFWKPYKNVIVKLTNYKNLTALEADEIIGECAIAQSMIHEVWNKLGLRQGYVEPILRGLKGK